MQSWALPLLVSCVLSSPLMGATPELPKDPSRLPFVALETFDYSLGGLRKANAGSGWKGPWQTSRVAPPTLVAPDSANANSKRHLQIQGTGSRNNPLRRELGMSFSEKELFVSWELTYRGETKKTSAIDPEFFVLWLDRLEGSDRATHAANVPNIGVHLADRGPQKGKNVFMIRIGPAHT
ncbi:MAG: hypothetical protein KDA84_30110, partial [Planctomycetaceae bacterium]|nr:hypothetical protein [Planctomycetaceae bacterium]